MCSKLKCSRCRCWKLEKEFVNTHEFAFVGTLTLSSRIMRTCNSCRKRNKPHPAVIKAKKVVSQRCNPPTVPFERWSYAQNSLPVMQVPSSLPCFRPCQDSYVKSNVCQPQSYPSQETEARSFTVSPSSSNNKYFMGLKIAGSSPVNSFEVDRKVREENVALHPLPYSIPMNQQPFSSSSSSSSPLQSPYPYSYSYSYSYCPYPMVRAAYYPTYLVNPGSAMPPAALSSCRARPYACSEAQNMSNCSNGPEAAVGETCMWSSLDILVALSKRELELMKSKSHVGVTLCSEKEAQSGADGNL